MSFRLRPEQVAALRKQSIAAELIRSFEGSKIAASRDSRTGDVLAADPRGNVTRFGFDRKGFVGSVTSPLGRSWRIENDDDGLPLAMSNPAGLHLSFAYDQNRRPVSVARANRQIARFSYEPSGSPTEIVQPDGGVTRIAYRDPRRVASVRNPLDEIERYDYDDHGALTAITDGNANRTEFRNDWLGRPIEARYADGSVERYGYGGCGELASIESGGRVVLRMFGSDRMYGDGESMTFSHDAAGRVLEAACPEITVRYRYDAESRVIEEDQGGEVIRYTYDAAGNLTGLTFPSGEQVAYSYDADLRLEKVTNWNGGVHRFEYAPGDRAITLRAPNGVTTATIYSEDGLPVAITASSAGSSQALFDLHYEYDDEGRVRSFRNAGERSRGYEYDAAGRLIAVHSGDRSLEERFAYDSAGNRTHANGEDARFNLLNQVSSQGDRRFDYDHSGNLVAVSGPASWRYTYNGRNLLVRAEGPNGRVVAFGYDGFGRRMWKRSGAVEVRYIWAGEQMVREIRKEQGRVRVQDYLYVPGTFTPLATRIDGQIYSCHTDHLGRVRRLTDSRGSLVWSADFTAFGDSISQSARVPFSLRLPGQHFDEETGLHYNRFRYYSPVLGRYLSRDPITYLSGLNFYTYAYNDPINRADPTGLWTWAGVAKIAAVAAVSIAVGAAVVAFAPVALPLAIIAAGVAAGAVGGALNTVLNGNCSWNCIGPAMLKGAAVGLLAALPFAFLPAAAGVMAYAGAGAASGAMSYTADYALEYPYAKWSWGGLAASVAIGAVTGGAGRYLATGTLLQKTPYISALAEEIEGESFIEPGAVPGTIVPEPVSAPAVPPGWDPHTDALPATEAVKFQELPKPDVLSEGKKIYRVIDGRGAFPNGKYWCTEPPPSTEAQWRSGYAVKNRWNGDGSYVEHTVGEGGLRVWRGPTAPQDAALPGWKLPGGAEQLYVPSARSLQTSAPMPTPWNTGLKGLTGGAVGAEAAQGKSAGGEK